MMALRMIMVALALMAASAGGFAQTVLSPLPTGPVRQGTAITYADLVALVIPGVTVSEGRYSGGSTIPVGDIGIGEIDDTLAPESMATLIVSAIPVRSGGLERMALLLDFGTGRYTVGFAILALFDISDEPALIAAANVAFGDSTGFIDPALLPIHKDNDLLVIRSTHTNSSQYYANISLVLIRDDRLELIDTIFALSDRTCAFERTQQFDIREGKGEPFADFAVTVTETTALTGERCGDADVPQAGTREIETTYRWDAAARRYEPDSDAIAVLARENDERL